jgi:hypothetical protein
LETPEPSAAGRELYSLLALIDWRRSCSLSHGCHWPAWHAFCEELTLTVRVPLGSLLPVPLTLRFQTVKIRTTHVFDGGWLGHRYAMPQPPRRPAFVASFGADPVAGWVAGA